MPDMTRKYLVRGRGRSTARVRVRARRGQEAPRHGGDVRRVLTLTLTLTLTHQDMEVMYA